MTTPVNLEAGTTRAAPATEPRVTLEQKHSVFGTVFGRWLNDFEDKLYYELMFQKIDEHASYERNGRLTDAVIEGNIRCINVFISFLRGCLGTRWDGVLSEIQRTDELKTTMDNSGYSGLAKVLEVTFDIWIHIEVPGRYLVSNRKDDNPYDFPWSQALDLVDNINQVLQRTNNVFFPGDDLSASDLQRFYPVRIVRTLYVNNHLRYDRDPSDGGKPTLEVFIDWSALVYLEQEPADDYQHPLPDGLSADVSGVLSLMFKESRGTRHLIRSKARREKGEQAKRAWKFVDRAPAPEHLQFQFFTDRLRYIHTLYNSSPDGWWQPLFDQRNREKHLALVIAVFAFVFALLSTATGALSAVYAILQYNLAVDAACAEVGDSPRMAKYCN